MGIRKEKLKAVKMVTLQKDCSLCINELYAFDKQLLCLLISKIDNHDILAAHS